MRKAITSPQTFKTCYIAAVKEELGLLKRKRTAKRKVKPPQHLRWAIKEALTRKPNATYKEIQRLAFEIYRQKERENLPFFGALGEVPDDILWEVIDDKGLSYED
ncbi:MAG TPA: hypothetical protein EYO62_04395 [Aquificales bacterium]|nr:hypothetical protein [Aquificales bacterium]